MSGCCAAAERRSGYVRGKAAPDFQQAGFFELAAESRGEVLLNLPDGSRADLKRDSASAPADAPAGGGVSAAGPPRPGTAASFVRYPSEAAL